jgi:hypothetical protein
MCIFGLIIVQHTFEVEVNPHACYRFHDGKTEFHTVDQFRSSNSVILLFTRIEHS